MGDFFGWSASVSGTTAVVGAPYEDMGGSDAGAAYFFERDPESGQWEQVAKRFGWDAQAFDQFGWSVSISGTTAVVGAHGEDTGGFSAGAAYFFERDPESGLWEQVAKLIAPDAEAGDQFGWSVSVSGTRAVVGAYGEDTGGVYAGAAYVFERNATSGQWDQVAKLKASDAQEGDFFGSSVSISGTMVVVGADREDTGGAYAGAAYVFEQNPSSVGWLQVAKLTASDAEANDNFGSSVSVSGSTAVVGAYREDMRGSDAGAAYVFERNAATGAWEEVAKLTASDAQAYDRFGSSVSVSGAMAVVGASGEDTGGLNAGAAYVFERNAASGAWEEVARLTASDAQEGDVFGSSVSVSGTTALVGAKEEDTGGANAGAAYVFEW